MTVLVDCKHRCQVKRLWRFGLAKHTAGSCDASSLKNLQILCVECQLIVFTSTRGHRAGSKWAFAPNPFACSDSALVRDKYVLFRKASLAQ